MATKKTPRAPATSRKPSKNPRPAAPPRAGATSSRRGGARAVAVSENDSTALLDLVGQAMTDKVFRKALMDPSTRESTLAQFKGLTPTQLKKAREALARPDVEEILKDLFGEFGNPQALG